MALVAVPPEREKPEYGCDRYGNVPLNERVGAFTPSPRTLFGALLKSGVKGVAPAIAW